MTNLIEQRVDAARRGANPYVVARLASGWVVIGDVQPLHGYCLLLADPVVSSLNDLGIDARIRYSLDAIAVGDALLAVTGAYRINYETLGNSEPALHTHIIPRYLSEPDDLRRDLAFRAYDWSAGRKTEPARDRPFMLAMAQRLREAAGGA